METFQITTIYSNSNSSYPTYEEWKQLVDKEMEFKFGSSSYPTYEEWKLLSKSCLFHR